MAQQAMNLEVRLREIREAFESGDTPREIVEVFDAHVKSLLASNVEQNALQFGGTAPLNLEVETASGKESLKSFLSDQFLVLTWFRGNW